MTPRAAVLCLIVVVSGCLRSNLQPELHYVLGQPYQAGGVWHYPREMFDLDETGLAAVTPDSAPRLTADGEVFDQTALAAAHATMQLPAIGRLTNLLNGRQVAVRVNDRGSGDPRRLVEITRRTAKLLDIPPEGVARVRLQVLPNESHAAADALPGAPSLAIAAAPRGQIEVTDLAPPPGVRQGNRRAAALPAPMAARTTSTVPPLRLPETVTQTVPRPGRLFVRLDTFDEFRYADVQRAKLAASGAYIVATVQGGRHRFQAGVGPLADVLRAEAVLAQALAAGIPDARIVVD